MIDCECHYYANQYGAWYKFCDSHFRRFTLAASTIHMTLEQFLVNALDEYVFRTHPDRKRWLT